MWEIEYYMAANGRIPVKEFIEALNLKEKAKVARTIDHRKYLRMSLRLLRKD
jgi:hypothetical protein